jgi:hypothetical protein
MELEDVEPLSLLQLPDPPPFVSSPTAQRQRKGGKKNKKKREKIQNTLFKNIFPYLHIS